VVIAIDGPVAAGKTSVANRLAAHFGFSLLDTGAIYRCVALQCRREEVEFSNEEAVATIASDLPIEFHHDGKINRVLLARRDVSDAIRTPEISKGASIVSALPLVRVALLGLQRTLGAIDDVIAEGRDIGTVVFPGASVKIFLTAEPRVRAKRRHHELAERGDSASLDEVLAALLERDTRDSSRSVAPLIAAEEAVVVDSSILSLDEVTAFLLGHIEAELTQLRQAENRIKEPE